MAKKDEKPKEKKQLEKHLYQVCYGENNSKILLTANQTVIDGDELNFYDIIFTDEGDEEQLVGSFKQWNYFVRCDAGREKEALHWGKKFEDSAVKDE